MALHVTGMGSQACSLDLEGGLQIHAAQPPHSATRYSHCIVTVVFQHVTFEIISQGRGRQRRQHALLHDVTGCVLPGELTAVLGPSGSGKTTLLDLLSGRKTIGHLSPGSLILFNSRLPTHSMLRRDVGYVEQHDTLLPLLTPAEMLMYTAELKQPRSMSVEEKRRLVEELVDRLSLEDCQDTTIGSAMTRGISGGEAKRVNVGVSMINRPAVLLCDEPTSGLDSWSAHSVVSALRELAQDGIAVCSTIHSPPPDTFALFQKCLVLQKGQVVYFGENGDPAEAYFATLFPHLRARRPTEGISDYIIDVTTFANKQGEEAAAAFADAYAGSELRRRNEEQIAALLAAAPPPADGGHGNNGVQRLLGLDGRLSQGTVTPWWWGLLVLARYRSVRAYSRPSWLLPRALGPAIPVFLLVTVYWSMGDNLDPEHAISIAAVLFMVTTSCAYGSMGLLSTLVVERAVYLRERSDGLYTPATYLLYKVVEELVVVLAVSFSFCALVFYLVRLQGSVALFWLVYMLTSSVSTALALLVGSLSPSLDVAGMALPAYTTTLLYFSGFLITWSNLPVYWGWYSVICYLRYAWGALMVNQFEGERNIVAFGGQPVLDYFDLEHVDKWAWLGWECLFLLAFLSLTWLALTLVRHQQR